MMLELERDSVDYYREKLRIFLQFALTRKEFGLYHNADEKWNLIQALAKKGDTQELKNLCDQFDLIARDVMKKDVRLLFLVYEKILGENINENEEKFLVKYPMK